MNTILLIEDDEDIRQNIAELLTMANYRVLAACNGKEGVEMARSAHPDLVISDINMPYIDGYGVLQILQKDDETKNTPFIFLSSKAETADLRQAMKLGANDYITKPFEGSDLLSAVEARLSTIRQKPSVDNPFREECLVGNGDPLRTLLENADVVEYTKKQLIYKEGSSPRFLYFIKKGRVRTFKSHEDGKDLVMGLFGENDFIGYAPILENVYHIETAEATEDTELALIPRKDFEALVTAHPGVMKKFIGLLTKNLIEMEEQLLGTAYNTLRKKVASALVTLGKKYNRNSESGFAIQMSRDELASIAGTATESLIRTLTEFRHEKLIDMENGAITIVSEHRLRHLLR